MPRRVRNPRITPCTVRAITAVLLSVALMGAYVWRVEHRLANLETLAEHEVKTTWKSGGVEKEVRTTRNVGETLEQWQDRHFALVRERQAEFPPDSE